MHVNSLSNLRCLGERKESVDEEARRALVDTSDLTDSMVAMGLVDLLDLRVERAHVARKDCRDSLETLPYRESV